MKCTHSGRAGAEWPAHSRRLAAGHPLSWLGTSPCCRDELRYSTDLFLACASPAHKNTISCLSALLSFYLLSLPIVGPLHVGTSSLLIILGSSILNFYDLHFAPAEPPCIIWPRQRRGNDSQTRGPFGMNNLSHFHNASYVKLCCSYLQLTEQWGADV